MSRLLILLLLAHGVSYADCYTRSATFSKVKSSIQRVSDIERTLIPDNRGYQKCRIMFRAYIDGTWHTAEGEAIGSNRTDPNQICASALDEGRVKLLTRVNETGVTSTQELICTDQPIPEEKERVKIGDVVHDSEVQPHPLYPSYFSYRGAQCRWFIESTPEIGKVSMEQGVICRSPAQKTWKVVDKW